MSAGDPVEVRQKVIPDDYHCRCHYCLKTIGELRPSSGGTYYSRLERNKYYDPVERGSGGHIAKTPLHVARWAIQEYTVPGDWVVDPTMGAGTTAVESITQGRNVAGMELQFSEVLEANVRKNLNKKSKVILRIGDARNIKRLFSEEKVPKASLVINNPPYSGDEAADGKAKRTYYYDRSKPNLAFLKENEEYWQTIQEIYQACADHLIDEGKFVIAVKDMMRNKKPYLLHKKLGDVLTNIGLTFVGAAFLNHYPRTLFMNTYKDRFKVAPPYYQSILVFEKV